MSDVFLSYASEDRNVARAIVEALGRQGWSVWWDRAIRPGSAYEREIDQAISGARCVVVLWSSASIHSNWVSNEALEGQERGILVPVRLEDVRIPVAFRGVQAASLEGWPASAQEGEYEKFIEAISAILAQSPAGELDPRAAPRFDIGKRDAPHSHGAARPQENSVAVLPFENLTGDPKNDYVCDGFADELRSGLARVDVLHVVPRSSSAHAMEQADDVRVIGQLLDAEKVIEGRVRQFGPRLRLTVEITDVVDGYQSWSQSFELTEETLFETSDELVTAALSQFKQKDTATTIDYAPDPIAYQHYLRGRFHVNGGDTLSRRRAIVEYRKAVEIDPDFLLAHCGLATAHLIRHIGSNDPTPPSETFAAAVEASQKAYALDPNNAMSIGVMGCTYFYDWQWEKAEEYLERSLELDPTDTMVRHTYASLLNYNGDTARAGEFMKKSLQYEPLSPIAVNGTARILRYMGRIKEAHEICERLLTAMPNSLAAIEEMTESALAVSDYDLAEERIEAEAKHLGVDHPTVVFHRIRVAYGRNELDLFHKHFNQLKLIARTAYINSSVMAFCYLFAGDIDKCFEYLDQAVAEKDSWMVDLAILPLPEAIVEMDRFQEILGAVRHSPPTVA